ncbi:YxeA family protein [Alkalicoccobacillus plakortidis]|uniref:YxeA family protein n=1 Tax=Alkalicoccobacillus plakortidis TaxID=444060 RepID=A0ABT0XKF7_9BACI|nr:YxeA family protein [Alkalicoccobacillus plakortidis]MCM2676230.1 YxeA family protein [Alkalicoccobacillus plakortidis]
MKKILISCLVLVVVITSLYFFFRETIDRFNPMIAEEYVYVEVQDDPSDDDGRYKYNLKGINESNETKRVVFSTKHKTRSRHIRESARQRDPYNRIYINK